MYVHLKACMWPILATQRTRAKLKMMVDASLATSAQLNDTQKMLAEYFDDKVRG